MAGRDELFLPQLVEDRPASWQVEEVDLRNSSVDMVGRHARVPRAHTEAQAQARLHEMCHVKESPRDIKAHLSTIMAHASSMGLPPIDTVIALRLAKMLEENRIDWLLWKKYGEDDRAARESLDWSKMPAPDDVVYAVEMVLQLAWSCWPTVGVVLPDGPPPRSPDPSMAAFFVMCWNAVHYHNPDILPALVRACYRMYETPTHDARDKASAELASFFPVSVPDAPQPPKKEEQRQAEKEAEAEEEARDKARKAEEGGETEDPEILDPADLDGEAAAADARAEIHDHTTGIRRPSLRIARRDVPQFTGTRLVFPHRYMVDKAIFSRRVLTEGGIMVDGSGSMSWKHEDLKAVLDLMPAVWVGLYSGFNYTRMRTVQIPAKYTRAQADQIIGRICVLAKNGRFAKYDGREQGHTAGNEVDVEALHLLAEWPEPRLWLSDGLVTGGVYMNRKPLDPRWGAGRRGHRVDGTAAIVDRTNAIMKRARILRVETKEDMLKLLKRQRVTVYRSCINAVKHAKGMYPAFLKPEPVTIQL